VTKQAAGVVDQRIAKALSHPVRAHILQILNDRVASPNEIAEEIKEPLGNVSYHVRALLNLGCVELVRTAPRRGAIEHYYRAIARPFFSDRDWTKLPQSARQAISDVVLESIWSDVNGAMEDGTFEVRSDRHLSRTALLLDEQGWEELNEILKGVVEDAMRIETESASRRAESGEKGFNTKLAIMHFETETAGDAPAKASAKRGGRGKAKARR
jgi:DNA-binding transcriptional ArsR family regulator